MLRLFPPDLLISLLVSTLMHLLAAPAPAQDTASRSHDALRDSIEAVLDRTGAPGAGVVLFAADSIRWEGYVGLADRAADRPVTAETVFRAGSISKSLVATAVLMLVEAGRLDLDTPVRDLAPEIEMQNPWAETHPVRVAHLLEHTAGFDDLHLHEYTARAPDLPLREGLAVNPATRHVRWRPGLYYSYSNAGPPVAAYLVEHITGQPFEAFVVDRIFEPLGMTASSFFRDERVETHLATGYASDGETVRPYAHIGVRPSGALNARPTDLARFGQMLLGRGARGAASILDSASVERMETPTTSLAARHGMATGYGLGNATSSQSGFLIHGHSGGIDGFVARYGYLPGYDRGFVVMSNSENGAAHDRIEALVRGFLTRPLTPPEPPAVADLPTDSLTPHTGYYVSITPRQEITRFIERLLGIVRIDTTARGLTVSPALGTADSLLPVDAQRFRGTTDPAATAVFAQNPAGARVLVGSGSAVRGTFASISGVSAWGRWITAGLSLLLLTSTALFALYWVPAKALGRLGARESIHLRLWPLVATGALGGAFALLVLALQDPIPRLGHPTVYSVGFTALTLLFGGAMLASLVALVRSRKQAFWGTWAYHGLVVAAGLVVLIYLAAHGLIGHRFWT